MPSWLVELTDAGAFGAAAENAETQTLVVVADDLRFVHDAIAEYLKEPFVVLSMQYLAETAIAQRGHLNIAPARHYDS